MERLDKVMARVLANVRVTMEERAREARSLPSEAARIGEGAQASAQAMVEVHPRSSNRSIAKRATTASAKRETA